MKRILLASSIVASLVATVANADTASTTRSR